MSDFLSRKLGAPGFDSDICKFIMVETFSNNENFVTRTFMVAPINMECVLLKKWELSRMLFTCRCQRTDTAVCGRTRFTAAPTEDSSNF